MGDITTNRHRETLDAALCPTDGQGIQKRLRRVFVPPIARIQNRAIHLLRQKVDRARRPVPHHQKIGVHRVQRHRRINQRLALFHRRGGHRHVHHIRPQPLARQFKTGLRAGGVFKEHVDLRQTGQSVRLFDGAPVQIDIAIGEIQNRGDFGGGQLLDAKKMTGAEGGHWHPPRHVLPGL